jgi:hypothetical protein
MCVCLYVCMDVFKCLCLCVSVCVCLCVHVSSCCVCICHTSTLELQLSSCIHVVHVHAYLVSHSLTIPSSAPVANWLSCTHTKCIYQSFGFKIVPNCLLILHTYECYGHMGILIRKITVYPFRQCFGPFIFIYMYIYT